VARPFDTMATYYEYAVIDGVIPANPADAVTQPKVAREGQKRTVLHPLGFAARHVWPCRPGGTRREAAVTDQSAASGETTSHFPNSDSPAAPASDTDAWLSSWHRYCGSYPWTQAYLLIERTTLRP
jgi:hypothetical protein